MQDENTPRPDDDREAALPEQEGLDGEPLSVEDTDDGGAIVRLEEQKAEAASAAAHFANIVDEVNQFELDRVTAELLDKIEKDKEARAKRDKLYEEGIRRTGLGNDAPGGAQFQGANKVVHPMLVEACVDFSARVIKELLPPGGPVKTKTAASQPDKKLKDKAERKAEFMNLQITEQMPEFRGELEQLTTQMPLGGGQYLKVMWSPEAQRPCVEFVPIDDVYLPFAATNFYTAERRTHVQYVTAAQFGERVRSGMYRDIMLVNPGTPDFSRASKANDKIEGRTDTAYNEDGLRVVYEVSTRIAFGEDEAPAPYIISIDAYSRQAVCLYRNWAPEDAERRQELEWMVEFPFVPWRGAYPIGLTHMIGGLSGAATGALRALLDSAHIQNVPTLLKLKGGPGGQTLNVQPTEVVEIEGGGVMDDIRKVAMQLPFPGPSPTLFQLLGFLVDAGRGVVQTSFEKLSDQNPNQPVGTTMALIEQGMVVFSSIHTRLHSAMGRVLRILHRINAAYLTEEMIRRDFGDELKVRPEDFDGPLDVIPVSNPAIFSEVQRFAQVQAVQQRAAMLPQIYDLRKVEQMFLRTMKMADEDILLPVPGEDNLDPASENVAATLGRPVYVLPKQDHFEHMQVHLAFLKSPLFGSNPAMVKTYLYPMAQHLRDHLLNFYLTESHRAVQIAEERGLLDKEDAGGQAALIAQVQGQIEQQLGAFAQELAQIDQAAQQFAPQPQLPPDSSLQVAQLNLQARQAELQQRAQFEQAKLQRDDQRTAQELQIKQAALQLDAQQAATGEQAENARTAAELEARERMNSADNATALQLAQIELMTGERIGVSTGTGINPGA